MIYVRAIDGMTNHTAGDLRSTIGDLIGTEGVLDLSTHLEVTENDTPDMSVNVAPGVAYVLNDDWTEFASLQKYWDVLVDAEENAVITANSSGSTRYDLICLFVDTTVDPDANASNVATVKVVAGTPGAGQPATPDNHLLLAVIEVADGATTIETDDITDSRVQMAYSIKTLGVTNLTSTNLTSTNNTLTNLSWNGWGLLNETFTYASASTITVATGAASRFQKGDKLKLTNNTVKYFYIRGVADTVLTVTGGSDYTLEDAAITSPYLSRIEKPFGFPTWFAYAPTVTSGSGTLTTASATGKFSLKGEMCHLQVAATITNKGTGGTDVRVTMPISASTGVGTVAGVGSSYNTFITLAVNLTGSGLLNIRKYDGTFYADNGQVLNAALTYQIS